MGNNIFPTLPIKGLSNLLHLKTFNNPALREFPSPDRFPRVQTMVLSYAYHCCSFLAIELDEPVTKGPVEDSVLFPDDNEFDMEFWNSSLTDIWPRLRESNKFFKQSKRIKYKINLHVIKKKKKRIEFKVVVFLKKGIN